MSNLKSVRVLYLKAALFLVCGLLAGALLLAETPNLRSALLLSLTVWTFCRAYYFTFYVIEHYVDSTYHFSGLWDFAKYSLTGSRRQM